MIEWIRIGLDAVTLGVVALAWRRMRPPAIYGETASHAAHAAKAASHAANDVGVVLVDVAHLRNEVATALGRLPRTRSRKASQ